MDYNPKQTLKSTMNNFKKHKLEDFPWSPQIPDL